jgi:hypothetical protein
MTDRPLQPPQEPGSPKSDEIFWAKRIDTLKVSEVPQGAVNLNVDGRRVVGALQGFGQLWQKTYTARLHGVDVQPADVVRRWKEHFPKYHPPESRFYPPLAGVAPGEVVLINASVTGMPVYTGVMVLYADDVSFTVMTAEGLPEAGWNTFSAYQEDGTTVIQVQSLARAYDPIYEIGYRIVGATVQEKIWQHVLTSLAADYGVSAEVNLTKVLVDPNLQWRQVKNIWNNAAMRSLLYSTTAPLRWVGRRLRKP